MKKFIVVILIILTSNTFAQDFDYLSDYEIKNKKDSEGLIKEAQKAANYILSIPINRDSKDRHLISSFLLKWNSVQFVNGFHINTDVSEMISNNQNFLSVYLSSMTVVIIKNASNEIEFKEIENQSIREFIKYCESCQLKNKKLITHFNNLKRNYVKKEINEIHAPNLTDKNGLKQGKWKEEVNEKKFDYVIMNYKDNVLNGEFTAYSIDNKVYMKGSFENGKLNGDHFTYYKNGELEIKKKI